MFQDELIAFFRLYNLYQQYRVCEWIIGCMVHTYDYSSDCSCFKIFNVAYFRKSVKSLFRGIAISFGFVVELRAVCLYGAFSSL